MYATRDETTGDVVLSTKPGEKVWADFFDLLRNVNVPSDFMSDRPMNQPPVEKNLFDRHRR